MLSTVLDIIARAGHHYVVALYCYMKVRIDGLLEFAVFTLDGYNIGLVVNRNGHSCWNFNGCFTYS